MFAFLVDGQWVIEEEEKETESLPKWDLPPLGKNPGPFEEFFVLGQSETAS